MFGFDPTRTVWLVNVEGNTVIFGGKFHVQSGKKYTVHGSASASQSIEPAAQFGSYMTTPSSIRMVSPLQPSLSIIGPSATLVNRSKTWRKTIVLVSLLDSCPST